MNAISIEELKASTRRANEERALEVINGIPEILRAAAESGEPWTVVTSYFVVPGLTGEFLAVRGKLACLAGQARLLHDHLKEHGLDPGFIVANSTGTLPDGSLVNGKSFKLVARWDNASEDNPLRQVYEKSVQARAREVIDRVPELVASAAARGNAWTPVYSFFTAPDLKDLAFDGTLEKLPGVARLVYEYLCGQKLNPRLFWTECEDSLGGCLWAGRRYYVIARWHDTGGGAEEDRATAPRW
jgi:hypothetical protein